MSTTKGTQHLVGEIHSASDLDFYKLEHVVFQVQEQILSCCLLYYVVHVADTRMARRYDDFLNTQIGRGNDCCMRQT